jgi:hypothetical protein
MNSFETKCFCGCYFCEWLLFLLEYKVTLKKSWWLVDGVYTFHEVGKSLKLTI